MLTQKGREPFIRMKMFLEDDNAVHKLVASQYKIAPEKLMRTGGYGINSRKLSHIVQSSFNMGLFIPGSSFYFDNLNFTVWYGARGCGPVLCN